ncbi:unnamed protein product [Rhizophagus irregularis]|uniref:Uncharacterized protein n=1 Tax=Rhizophagus irregularis TaxID=588596 RepID=A0A915YW69_9GLOM|nr:unnamed protein product [Rhizophagus irregularis]CAB5345268.1 unnamed protein product [Rhizophagus irregularis]
MPRGKGIKKGFTGRRPITRNTKNADNASLTSNMPIKKHQTKNSSITNTNSNISSESITPDDNILTMSCQINKNTTNTPPLAPVMKNSFTESSVLNIHPTRELTPLTQLDYDDRDDHENKFENDGHEDTDNELNATDTNFRQDMIPDRPEIFISSVTKRTEKKTLDELINNVNILSDGPFYLSNKHMKLDEKTSSTVSSATSMTAVPSFTSAIPSPAKKSLLTSHNQTNIHEIEANNEMDTTTTVQPAISLRSTVLQSSLNNNTLHDQTNINLNNNNAQLTQLATLFINESKVLFFRIRKPTPELILALARECAKHLGITKIDAGDVKKKGCGWFATWRVKLYDECTEIAFDFLDHYIVTQNNLLNSSHLQNFISKDDIIKVFEPQLKQVKRDHLFENQTSWIALKNYLSEVVLIIVCYFVQKDIDRTIYFSARRNKRTGWRSAILTDLHNYFRRWDNTSK